MHPRRSEVVKKLIDVLKNIDSIQKAVDAAMRVLTTTSVNQESSSKALNLLAGVGAAEAATALFASGIFWPSDHKAINNGLAGLRTTLDDARSSMPPRFREAALDVLQQVEMRTAVAYFEFRTPITIVGRVSFDLFTRTLTRSASSLANTTTQCLAGSLTLSCIRSLDSAKHPYLHHLLRTNKLEFVAVVRPTEPSSVSPSARLNLWSDEDTAIVYKEHGQPTAIIAFLGNTNNPITLSTSLFECNTAFISAAPETAPVAPSAPPKWELIQSAPPAAPPTWVLDAGPLAPVAPPAALPAKALKLRLREHVQGIVDVIQKGEHQSNQCIWPMWEQDAIRESSEPCNIYVIGDLEGNMYLLCQWLLERGLLKSDMTWDTDKADRDNVFVVQCGDQLDNGNGRETKATRSTYKHIDTDLAVPLFMDYLNIVSKGRVVSILGNHEIMNMQNDQRYCMDEYCISLAERSRMFDYSKGIMAFIMKRRHMMMRMNQLVFSHGGLTKETLIAYNTMFNKSGKINLDDLIQVVNFEVLRPEISAQPYNLGTQVNQKLLADSDGEKGILWERYRGTVNYDPWTLTSWMDSSKDRGLIMNNINSLIESRRKIVQITGHNTVDSMRCCTDYVCHTCPTTASPYTDDDERLRHVFTDVGSRRGDRPQPNTVTATLVGMHIKLNARGTPTYAENVYEAVDIVGTLSKIMDDETHALNTDVAIILGLAQDKISGTLGGAKRTLATKKKGVVAGHTRARRLKARSAA
jgi:hypothetical protein